MRETAGRGATAWYAGSATPATGASLIGLAAGHYVVKCFPDDLAFEPSEFDLKGPDRTDLEIRIGPPVR